MNLESTSHTVLRKRVLKRMRRYFELVDTDFIHVLPCRPLALCSGWSFAAPVHWSVADLGGPLAQLAEQLTLNQPVVGSIPTRLTTIICKIARDRRRLSRRGEVSELADEHDLGSCAARRRSSSLLFPT